jgi:hypothetical protein
MAPNHPHWWAALGAEKRMGYPGNTADSQLTTMNHTRFDLLPLAVKNSINSKPDQKVDAHYHCWSSILRPCARQRTARPNPTLWGHVAGGHLRVPTPSAVISPQQFFIRLAPYGVCFCMIDWNGLTDSFPSPQPPFIPPLSRTLRLPTPKRGHFTTAILHYTGSLSIKVCYCMEPAAWSVANETGDSLQDWTTRLRSSTVMSVNKRWAGGIRRERGNKLTFPQGQIETTDPAEVHKVQVDVSLVWIIDTVARLCRPIYVTVNLFTQ